MAVEAFLFMIESLRKEVKSDYWWQVNPCRPADFSSPVADMYV